MNILVTSDWHADHVTQGVSRYQDVATAALQTAHAAIEARVDLYAFLGDLADPDDAPSVLRAVALAIDIATMLAKHGITSVWLAGNHDVVEDGSGLTTLSPMRNLGREEIALIEQPEQFELPTGEVQFLALPFAAVSHEYAPAEFLHHNNKSGLRRIILSHLAFPGMQPGEETTEMPRGRNVVFPNNLLGPGDVVLQGHYHRRTSWDVGENLQILHGAELHVPGSLVRLTHGEEKNQPGYLIIEV